MSKKVCVLLIVLCSILTIDCCNPNNLFDVCGYGDYSQIMSYDQRVGGYRLLFSSTSTNINHFGERRLELPNGGGNHGLAILQCRTMEVDIRFLVGVGTLNLPVSVFRRRRW